MPSHLGQPILLENKRLRVLQRAFELHRRLVEAVVDVASMFSCFTSWRVHCFYINCICSPEHFLWLAGAVGEGLCPKCLEIGAAAVHGTTTEGFGRGNGGGRASGNMAT